MRAAGVAADLGCYNAALCACHAAEQWEQAHMHMHMHTHMLCTRCAHTTRRTDSPCTYTETAPLYCGSSLPWLLRCYCSSAVTAKVYALLFEMREMKLTTPGSLQPFHKGMWKQATPARLPQPAATPTRTPPHRPKPTSTHSGHAVGPDSQAVTVCACIQATAVCAQARKQLGLDLQPAADGKAAKARLKKSRDIRSKQARPGSAGKAKGKRSGKATRVAAGLGKPKLSRGASG